MKIRILVIFVFIAAIAGTAAFSAPALPDTAKELQGEITVSTTEKIGEINPDIYGLFMELCYNEFDGGIWAEMLKGRKFAEEDREDDKDGYGVVKHWFAIGRNEKTHFTHDCTTYYCGSRSQKIINENGTEHKTGIGQKGLYLDKTKTYQVRVNIRQENIKDPVVIALEGEKGIYAQKEINVPNNKDWNRFAFTLKPAQTDKNGTFTITFKGNGILWVGSVSLMPDDNISGFRKDVIEALQAIHPPNIRWPGGNTVSCYHWEDGIGDRDKRPAMYNKAFPETGDWETNDVGTDEFMELCRILGAKPYVAVNAGDGTPQEAANFVEYCNGSANTKYGKTRAKNGHSQPYNIKLWGIGNEMFGNWQIGHVDEESYAKRHLAIAKVMRAVDKDIKIVAVGGRYWKFPRWNQTIFKTAGEYIDYLSLHSYAKKYRRTLKKDDLKDPNLAEETYYYIASSPYGIEEQIVETDKEIRRSLPRRPDVKIAFDEWNASLYRIPKIDYALRDGIYAAGVLHAFRRRHNAVTLANFASAVNVVPLIRVNENDIFFNPQYFVFKMYGNHGGPMLLKTDVKCDGFPAPEYEEGRPQAKGQIPYLDVSATTNKDGSSVYLAVINLHANKKIKTRISFEQWDFLPAAKIFELYADDYMTENTFENPNKISIKEDTLNGISNPFDYTFKPHSVTIMEFLKK
jgi:alpha-N-arabinofuranosidase